MKTRELPLDSPGSAVYTPHYFRSWGMEAEDNPSVEKMKRKTARFLLKKIEDLTPKGPLLDVGCAFGHFLQEANDRGWDVYGVEISAFAANLARKKWGEKIIHDSFLAAALPEKFFHVVIMSDVIEHFPDPRPVLEKTKKIISPKGTVVIVTPNTKSLSALLMGRRWPHFNPKEHLIYFNPETMKKALENNDFELLKLGPSPKWMNLNYLNSQFTVYRHPLFTPIINFLVRIAPQPLREIDVPLLMGDLLAIARKKDT
ncbi:MAG: class I SAM-dependent methyltransferase [Syntrophales bacterium]|nr:class I SAM-dependent methyltransferase [Syntrophales bacterium]